MDTLAPVTQSPSPCIVYHAADLDGKCSAAIALRALSSRPQDLLPIDYGWPLPALEDFPAGADVYILDFSFPPTYFHALTERCRVTWIDHHTPRIRECQAAGIPAHCVATCLSDHEPSATYLTWTHFHPGQDLPEAVNLIDAWDSTLDPRRRGTHWDLFVRPFQLGARIHDCDPASPIWDYLLDASRDTDRNALIHNGRAILQYLDQTNRELLPKLAYTLQLHLPPIMASDPADQPGQSWAASPMRALLLNRHPSDPKDLLCHPDCSKPELAPHVLITWGYEGGAGLWRLSLSPGPAAPDLDCGRIARAVWQGGGHPGRAGATLTRLPTELLPYNALSNAPVAVVPSVP